jgi:hypothetical protein
VKHELAGDGKEVQAGQWDPSEIDHEHHLTRHGFQIDDLTPNGDWFAYCQQELVRLGGMARSYSDKAWLLAYLLGILGAFLLHDSE